MYRTLLQDNVVDAVTILAIVKPTSNTGTSGSEHVFEGADTTNECAPNSLVKYINIRLESGLRDVAPSAPGFLEYAIIVYEQQTTEPTVPAGITSGIGTQTLGNLCKNFYRGQCIWDGAMAISRELPRVLDLKIKLPTKYCKNQRGKYIMLMKNYRTNDVSDTTSDCRTWYSHQYKCYI